MRVAFTGTKSKVGLTARQMAALRARLLALRPTVFVHGGCVGADNDADLMAALLGIPRRVFPSDCPEMSVPPAVLTARGPVVIEPARPALTRNPLIVGAADYLLACPRQPREVLRSGTWATVRAGRRVLGADRVEILTP